MSTFSKTLLVVSITLQLIGANEANTNSQISLYDEDFKHSRKLNGYWGSWPYWGGGSGSGSGSDSSGGRRGGGSSSGGSSSGGGRRGGSSDSSGGRRGGSGSDSSGGKRGGGSDSSSSNGGRRGSGSGSDSSGGRPGGSDSSSGGRRGGSDSSSGGRRGRSDSSSNGRRGSDSDSSSGGGRRGGSDSSSGPRGGRGSSSDSSGTRRGSDSSSDDKDERYAIRLNCGGNGDDYDYDNYRYWDNYGNLWFHDYKYQLYKGDTYHLDIEIYGTDDDNLYKSDRYIRDYDLVYKFDHINNGRYFIKLHFAEVYYSHLGQRVFDIYVNDEVVEYELDIYGRAGFDTALILEYYNIGVYDNSLRIKFARYIENPKVNAIEVYQVD